MAEENKSRALEIEEAATKLFARHGFDGVSVRDICSEVSVNCSTISYYFGGKKGLYLKVLRSQFAIYEEALDSLIAQNLSPEEELKALIDRAREIHARCPYFSAITSREGCYPSAEFVQALKEHEGRYNGGHLMRLISDGQRQGVFNPKVSAVQVSRLLSMVLNSQIIARSLSEILHPDFVFTDAGYYSVIKSVLLDGLMANRSPAQNDAPRPTGKLSAAPVAGKGRGLG